MSELDKTDLSGGDVAAIIIGSCVGVIVVIVAGIVSIKAFVQGCIVPTVIPTKMM